MSPTELPVRDPIDIECEQPELGKRLRDTLRDFDTDEGEFAESVRTRVREQRTNGRLDTLRRSQSLHRAASVLPPVLLPKSLAKLGLGTSGALLGKSGSLAGKGGLSGFAAVPAITAIMLVVSVWVVLRSLLQPSSSREQSNDHKWARGQIFEWWRENVLAALLVIAGLIALAFHAPGDAVTLLFIVSTLALYGLFGRLAASGVASRREIGLRAAGFLSLFGCWGFMPLGERTLHHTGLPGTRWVLPALLLGMVVCRTLGLGDTRRRLWTAGAWSVVWLVIMFAVLNWSAEYGRQRPLVPDDVRSWALQRPAEPSFDLLWPSLAQAVRQWNAAGLAPLELSGFEPLVRELLAAPNIPSALELLPLIELGLVDSAQLQALRAGDADRRVLDRRSDFWAPSYDLITRLAVDASVFSELDKDDLAAKILRTVPAFDNSNALTDLLVAARTLEALDRAERVPELTGIAQQSLLATWAPSAEAELACFAPSLGKLEKALASVDRKSSQGSIWLEPTTTAVRAMARWGVPEEIDLLALERWLQREAQRLRRSDFPLRRVLAYAGLAELRSFPELQAAHDAAPKPTLLELAWRWRLLAAAVLLAAFAVVTTWRAPVRKRSKRPSSRYRGWWWWFPKRD